MSSSTRALPAYYKVGILGASLMLITIVLVAIGYLSIRSLYSSSETFTDRYYPAFKTALALDRDLYQAQLAIELAMRSSDPVEINEQLAEYAENIGQSIDRFRLLQQLTAGLPHPEGLLQSFLQRRESWGELSAQVAEILAQNPSQAERESLIESARVRAMTRDFFAAQTMLDRVLDEMLDPLLTLSSEQLREQARQAQATVLMTLLVALLIGSWLTFAAVMTIRGQHIAIMAEKEERDRESHHKEFERRVHRAMELAQTEPGALNVVREAVGEVLKPDRRAELLLADASMAHLERVTATENASATAGCKVSKPHDCPAIRRNTMMQFESSAVFEACPHLKNRGQADCSATCIPVSIMGQTMGVLHATGAAGVLPNQDQLRALNAIVARAGDEIGLVRAFATKDRQANTDSLTGLLNRRSLELHLADVRSRPGMVYSVVFADLDHFKKLNDVHGHDAGDRALRLFADVLKSTLRPTDLAARWGGEEFVLVLPEAVGEQAIRVLERIRQALADRLAHGTVPSFTVSFGVSDSEHASSFDNILSAADEALLSAKRAGRNRIVCASVTVEQAEAAADFAESHLLADDEAEAMAEAAWQMRTVAGDG